MVEVWELLKGCPIRALENGDVLLEAGQVNQTMFLVLSGELSVHLDAVDGESISTIAAGQTVGELSLIDDSPATAFVVARTKTRLLAVDQETFWRLAGTSHEFTINLLMLFARRMRSSATTIVENSRLKREFEAEARVDGLTGLHNRRYLDENLERLVQRSARNDQPLSLVMFDVDHFKRFNDEYGHDAGDEVLIALASVVLNNLRPTDLAARYGGEEFVVVLPEAELEGAAKSAERLREQVAQARIQTADGTELPQITVSLGVAQLQEGEEAAGLLKRADTCLYQAKDQGRNRVVS